MAPRVGIALTPGTVTGSGMHIADEKDEWPSDVEQVPLPLWDTGVFNTELINLDKLPTPFTDLTSEQKDAFAKNPETLISKAQAEAPVSLDEGTYRGTQLALTKLYSLIEQSFSSFMDAANFEPLIPRPFSIQQKRELFMFTDPSTDGFPPHLNLAANKPASDANPGEFQKSSLSSFDLFNKMRLIQLSALIPTVVPNIFVDAAQKIAQEGVELVLGPMGRPDQGKVLADVKQYNKRMRQRTGNWFARNDIFDVPNIGDIADWWSDRRFAQQQFTGTNPTTIELATDFWIQHFIQAATADPADQRMKAKIQQLAATDRQSLYMQDYSYFRKAAGMSPAAEIKCTFEEADPASGSKKMKTSIRYGTSSVCLFHLPADGMLQPLAIVLDWKGSTDKSVTVYNRENSLSNQKEDWPWRYAKTCVQASDWLRHELAVHLTLTHFIEEATIVAAQRAFEDTHPVFQLLYPHWQKTLSLNAAARATLVPSIIIEIIGLTSAQGKRYLNAEYKAFDFKGRYVPDDLKRRGFPPEKLNDPKYLNYAYARCIYSMWFKIRAYVEEMLSIFYKKAGQDPDQMVKNDRFIKDWCTILQADSALMNGGADIKSFPTITTFTELVDAVTMCIHLASPQHTAVNYLQNYYQAFVVNKPSCLYRPLPASRQELDRYTEKDLVAALPMNHPREWLLASHIPYLLSFKPGDKESLIIYAASKYHLYKAKKGADEVRIKEAAANFYKALAQSESEFRKYGQDVWDSNEIKYDVLSPSWNAVSILI